MATELNHHDVQAFLYACDAPREIVEAFLRMTPAPPSSDDAGMPRLPPFDWQDESAADRVGTSQFWKYDSVRQAQREAIAADRARRGEPVYQVEIDADNKHWADIEAKDIRGWEGSRFKVRTLYRAAIKAAAPANALESFVQNLAASQVPLDAEAARAYHDSAWELYVTDDKTPVQDARTQQPATDALLSACRKAVVALAHASEKNGMYNEAYEALDNAINAEVARRAAPEKVTVEQDARAKVLEELAEWYEREGWLMDEDDLPIAIRAFKSSAIPVAAHSPAAPKQDVRKPQSDQDKQRALKIDLQLRVLGWNRAQSEPPIKIGKEYFVAQEIAAMLTARRDAAEKAAGEREGLRTLPEQPGTPAANANEVRNG